MFCQTLERKEGPLDHNVEELLSEEEGDDTIFMYKQ